MNDDGRIDPGSSSEELEDMLRMLKPRAPQFDVDAIHEVSWDRRHCPSQLVLSSRLSSLVIGGASAASALIAAGAVFALLQVQIGDLQQEIARLSQQQEQRAVIAQERFAIASTPTNEDGESPESVVGTDDKRFVFELPLLRLDELHRGKLTVGSHLNRPQYVLSDVGNSSSKVPSNQSGNTLDAKSDQSSPVTRATLRKVLLDT